MKAITVLFLFISIFALACHKDHVVRGAGSTSLFGKWELRNRSSSIPSVSYPPGNGNIAQFNQDSTYAFYNKSTTSSQGTFHIVMKNLVSGVNNYDSIYYKPSNTGDLIQLRNDTLIIGTSIADGLTSLYVRQ